MITEEIKKMFNSLKGEINDLAAYELLEQLRKELKELKEIHVKHHFPLKVFRKKICDDGLIEHIDVEKDHEFEYIWILTKDSELEKDKEEPI